jgi:hypothetical protein
MVDDFLEVDRHARLLEVAVLRRVVNQLGNLVQAQLHTRRMAAQSQLTATRCSVASST